MIKEIIVNNHRETYEEILINDRDDYIDELRKKWENSRRVKFVFD